MADVSAKYIEKIPNIRVSELKKVTPYLDEIEPKLTSRQRLFSWYYCFNGFNAADACRRAGHKYKNADDAQASAKYYSIIGAQNLTKPVIKEAIKLILQNELDTNKEKLETELFDLYYVQATYDPSMFYNTDGSPRFETWDEIPKKFRCCVESLETKYYGKDAHKAVTIMKLVDRKNAQDKLAKYVKMLNDDSGVNINVIGPDDETIKELNNIFNKNKHLIGDGLSETK